MHSFMELVKNLLTLNEEKYFLSGKLNQEPSEEHFGRQCACGGASDNPMLELKCLVLSFKFKFKFQRRY